MQCACHSDNLFFLVMSQVETDLAELMSSAVSMTVDVLIQNGFVMVNMIVKMSPMNETAVSSTSCTA